MDEHETIVYLAAFFDANGCIVIRQDETLYIGITQKIDDILHIYKNCFGGSISKQPTYHIYQLTSRRASEMLKTLIPYLILKKDEAKTAIEYQDLKGYKSEDVIQMRRDLLDTFNLLKEIEHQ